MNVYFSLFNCVLDVHIIFCELQIHINQCAVRVWSSSILSVFCTLIGWCSWWLLLVGLWVELETGRGQNFTRRAGSGSDFVSVSFLETDFVQKQRGSVGHIILLKISSLPVSALRHTQSAENQTHLAHLTGVELNMSDLTSHRLI